MSKIWTNGVQLSDWIENIVGEGEIALYKQFLLFPQGFQKLSVVDVTNWVPVFMKLRVKTAFQLANFPLQIFLNAKYMYTSINSCLHHNEESPCNSKS